MPREDKDIVMLWSLAPTQILRYIKLITEQSLLVSSPPTQHEATLASCPAKLMEEL